DQVLDRVHRYFRIRIQVRITEPTSSELCCIMNILRKIFSKRKNMNGLNPNEVESIRAPWFKPGEYVIIQTEMTAGDDAWIQDQLVRTEIGKQLAKQNMNVKIQVGSVKLATLKRMVKGWNILKTVKQQDGSTVEMPLPFSP